PADVTLASPIYRYRTPRQLRSLPTRRSSDLTNDIAKTETLYWDTDTELREIESNIQTITAGNGAIYACRNNEYYDFDPMSSHDIDRKSTRLNSSHVKISYAVFCLK